ncbi:Hypothetical protein A7982_05092 [Minicystis rosea]|nr:Hypothetical protein A7982_05092 [Minicystis rosea]
MGRVVHAGVGGPGRLGSAAASREQSGEPDEREKEPRSALRPSKHGFLFSSNDARSSSGHETEPFDEARRSDIETWTPP